MKGTRPCIWREGGERCDRTDHQARGLCAKHYDRARSHPEILALYPGVLPLPNEDPPTVCDCPTPRKPYMVWGTRCCNKCNRPIQEDITARRF